MMPQLIRTASLTIFSVFSSVVKFLQQKKKGQHILHCELETDSKGSPEY